MGFTVSLALVLQYVIHVFLSCSLINFLSFLLIKGVPDSQQGNNGPAGKKASQEVVKNANLFHLLEFLCKSSNIYLSWTKIEYQNNLNPIALFSTLNKR